MPKTLLRSGFSSTLVGASLMLSTVGVGIQAAAVSDTWCAPGLGGIWYPGQGRCTLSLTSRANATVTITLALPADLMDDPTAGPVLQRYALERGRSWRLVGDTLIHDNQSTAEGTVVSHSGTVKSVVVHEQFHTLTTNPNDAYRTFVFDLSRRKLLKLADLFQPGVDPLAALPPLARPYLRDALAAAPPEHMSDAYPFTLEAWEPHADGSGYSGDYQAFALTADELVIYMPGQPMQHENPPPGRQWQWSMDGGTVVMHMPLDVLRPILAPRYT